MESLKESISFMKSATDRIPSIRRDISMLKVQSTAMASKLRRMEDMLYRQLRETHHSETGRFSENQFRSIDYGRKEVRFGSLLSYRSGLNISASSSSPSKEISEPLRSISLWDIRDEIRERIRGFHNNNVIGSFLADSGNFQIEKEAAIEDAAVIQGEELACEAAGASARAPWQGCDEETGNDSGEVRGYSHLVSSLVCDEVAAEVKVERLKMTCMGQIWKSEGVGRASCFEDQLQIGAHLESPASTVSPKAFSPSSVTALSTRQGGDRLLWCQFLALPEKLSVSAYLRSRTPVVIEFLCSSEECFQGVQLLDGLEVTVSIPWLWKRRKKSAIAVHCFLKFVKKFSNWVFHKFKEKKKC